MHLGLQLLSHDCACVALLLVDIVVLLKHPLKVVHVLKVFFLDSENFERLLLGDEPSLDPQSFLGHLLPTHVGELLGDAQPLLRDEFDDPGLALSKSVSTYSFLLRVVVAFDAVCSFGLDLAGTCLLNRACFRVVRCFDGLRSYTIIFFLDPFILVSE
jgi:hypothetical protein